MRWTKQMPTTALPATSWGRKGVGSSRATVSGSARHLTRSPRSMRPLIVKVIAWTSSPRRGQARVRCMYPLQAGATCGNWPSAGTRRRRHGYGTIRRWRRNLPRLRPGPSPPAPTPGRGGGRRQTETGTRPTRPMRRRSAALGVRRQAGGVIRRRLPTNAPGRCSPTSVISSAASSSRSSSYARRERSRPSCAISRSKH